MDLSDLFPRDEIAARFADARFTSFGLADLPAIQHRKPTAVHGIGLAVWDIIATRGEVKPNAMQHYVAAEDPDLLGRIGKHIGKQTLFDIRYCKADRGRPARVTISEMLVAHVYPNDLFIGDIEFSDPDRPIRKSERKYPMTKYAGLGLLGPFLEEAKACAFAMGSENLRLVAATTDHVTLFGKHGFKVAEDSAIAPFALEFGASIPMKISLR